MVRNEIEWITAIKLWLQEHTDKDINDITSNEKIIVNNEEYNIGGKINNLRQNLKNRIKIDPRYLELGLKEISNANKKQADEWIQIIEYWKSQNPDKDINDISAKETIIFNNKEYNIGSKIHVLRKQIKQNKLIDPKYLELGINSKSNMNNIISEDEWIRIIKQWKLLNPDKDINDLTSYETMIIDNQEYQIGRKVYNIRKRLNKGKSIEPKYFELGLKKTSNNTIKKISEEEWITAMKTWLSQNSNKDINDISNREIVFINNKEYQIGRKITNLRQKQKRDIKVVKEL